MPALHKLRGSVRLPVCSAPRTRSFSSTSQRPSDFTHAIIGGGVIGLAVARQLQGRSSKDNTTSSVLIEKHSAVGTETSSRNSEVIHAGIYYGAHSLKTQLCIRGRQLLYEVCAQYDVPHRRTGKWVVAQDAAEYAQLEQVHGFATSVGVPTRFVSRDEAREREPAVQATAGVLESPTTGIVDSHALMQCLLAGFEEHGGIAALNSEVTRVVPRAHGRHGWEIWTRSSATAGEEEEGEEAGGEVEETCITADTLINAAGLYAVPLSNTILPPARHITPYYAKGTYWSYGLSQPKIKTLIYPAPKAGHGGLGTHLTLDLGGRIRFGPDVQWTDSPRDYAASNAHFEAAMDEIIKYLPRIDRSAVALDYCGIRPKLSKTSAALSGKNFNDFYIKKEEGFEGFINLLGIESPGLTASLAIAEMVEELLYK